ncbi:MAG: TGS domain-containing protein [Nanoarchaeota archaeon]
MPANVTVEFTNVQKKYMQAKTIEEKILALEEMLSKAPSHKGAETLRLDIKQKIAKLKEQLEKQKTKKKGTKQVGIKKEGAARITIIGVTMSGKSLLLSKLTNARPKIAEHEFTTKELEVGMMDYKGIKIQIIEIPAVVENFYYKERGGYFLSIIKESDLIILTYRNEDDRGMVLKELYKNNIELPIVYYDGNEETENLKNIIWKSLRLIYVYTKQPGKKPDFPPVALRINATVKDLAMHIHKDFLNKFNYAKVWGKSAKFDGQMVKLNHILDEGDVVEFHLK